MEEELNTNSQTPAGVGDAYGKSDAQMGIPNEDDIQQLISSIAGLDLPQRQQSTVLPPNYYTPDMNEPIVKGYVGGMPLVTAGIPMFSMSILKQADEELQEQKRLAYEKTMKEQAEKDILMNPMLITDDAKNENFVRYQTQFWDNFNKSSKEKYGRDWYAKARPEIIKEAAKITTVKQNLDNTFKMADIILMAKDTDMYVSDDAYKKAVEFKEWTLAADLKDMDISDVNKKVQGYKKYFTKINSLDETTMPLVTGINSLILEGDTASPIFQYGGDKAYAIGTKQGVAALSEEAIMEMIDGYIDNYYEIQYGKYDEKLRPNKEEYKKYALGKSNYKENIKVHKARQQAAGGAGRTSKPTMGEGGDMTIVLADNDGNNRGEIDGTDYTAFKNPVVVLMSGIDGIHMGSNGLVVSQANRSTKYEGVFNYKGYGFAKGADATDNTSVIYPLTSIINSHMIANNPEFNKDGKYKVSQNAAEATKAMNEIVHSLRIETTQDKKGSTATPKAVPTTTTTPTTTSTPTVKTQSGATYQKKGNK
jgi:hypothetical protein